MSDPHPDLASAFAPSFSGGRQEREWILRSLGGFHADEWLTDVLFRVNGGKEATVYCCRAHPETGLGLIAAKVFRPRMFRAMKNDALYKMGRLIQSREGKYPDDRTRRALRKRTAYGRRLDAASWCRWEYDTLVQLSAIGADVPRPLHASENAILMEFVGDEHGAAPILSSIRLEADEARAVFDRLLANIELFLSRFVIHADLSAYNVLYRDGNVRVIDFPQTIDALDHPRAFELFQRDIDRLCGYFARQGLEVDACDVARELWSRFLA
ncbi:MAG: RIO1 family regulatory kinase/ATPase domain-containing protein [Planctomycetota bacterium]